MTTQEKQKSYRFINDVIELAKETDISQKKLFTTLIYLATTLKINALSNGVPVEDIKKTEKSAIKSIADAYIRRGGQSAIDNLKSLDLYSGEVLALPTFPSNDEIKEINEILKSGKHWIIITRLGDTAAMVVGNLRRKYYPENDSDYRQEIFAFEEGTTTSKSGGILMTIAAKSRMTNEQLINELLPNPEGRMMSANQLENNSLCCFISLENKDGWHWMDRLAMAMGSKNEPMKALGLGGVGSLTTEQKRSLK
jgi:hypothetical protein